MVSRWLKENYHRLEPFLLTVNAYQPFVNENYLHVQCVILYHSYVIVEKEFVQKERNILNVIQEPCLYYRTLSP